MTNLSEKTAWPGIYQLEKTDPVVGGAGGISNRQAEQLTARTNFLRENSLEGYTYNPNLKYYPGQIIWVADDKSPPHIGSWYECYHPDGVKGKDPRNASNRPSGWNNSDAAMPYYWLKHGKHISSIPEGAILMMPTTTLKEGYIKANGSSLNKTKFWRLADSCPELVNGNSILLPNLSKRFIRGLGGSLTVNTLHNESIKVDIRNPKNQSRETSVRAPSSAYAKWHTSGVFSGWVTVGDRDSYMLFPTAGEETVPENYIANLVMAF